MWYIPILCVHTGYQVSGPVVPYCTLQDSNLPKEQRIRGQSVAVPILQGRCQLLSVLNVHVLCIFSLYSSD